MGTDELYSKCCQDLGWTYEKKKRKETRREREKKGREKKVESKKEGWREGERQSQEVSWLNHRHPDRLKFKCETKIKGRLFSGWAISLKRCKSANHTNNLENCHVLLA